MKSIRKFKHNIGNKAYASPFVVSYNPKTYQIKELELRRLIELENKKDIEIKMWKELRAFINKSKINRPEKFYYSSDEDKMHYITICRGEKEAHIIIYNLNVGDLNYIKAALKKYVFNSEKSKYRKVNLLLVDCYMKLK